MILSEGRETPDPESPDSDPDFRRSNPTGRAGAARPEHRRQETAPAPQHYPPDIQDARSPLGHNATRYEDHLQQWRIEAGKTHGATSVETQDKTKIRAHTTRTVFNARDATT